MYDDLCNAWSLENALKCPTTCRIDTEQLTIPAEIAVFLRIACHPSYFKETRASPRPLRSREGLRSFSPSLFVPEVDPPPPRGIFPALTGKSHRD